jgi:hypothetical protein
VSFRGLRSESGKDKQTEKGDKTLHRPNENKMSDGHRERAWLEVKTA